MIRTAPPENRTPLVEALDGDWRVRLARVHQRERGDLFLRLFLQGIHDLRDIGGVRIAAVGPVTAAHLKELHLQVDLMPEKFEAAAVASAFMKLGEPRECEDPIAARRAGDAGTAAVARSRKGPSWTTCRYTGPWPSPNRPPS
jgi:hypothetical protein